MNKYEYGIFIYRNGQVQGPFSLDEINSASFERDVTSSDSAWMDGWPAWQSLSAVAGFLPSDRQPRFKARASPRLPQRVVPSLPQRPWPEHYAPVPPVHPEHEALLRLFVGKNYDYYAKKWNLREPGGTKNSWNWAALFLVVNWTAYRKMYFYSWGFIVLCVVEAICERAFGLPLMVSNAVNVLLAIGNGAWGNGHYKLHVEEKLGKITPTGTSNEAIRMRVVKEGGTNLGAAVAFSFGVMIMLMIVAACAP